jgi:hypothetical protein
MNRFQWNELRVAVRRKSALVANLNVPNTEEERRSINDGAIGLAYKYTLVVSQ